MLEHAITHATSKCLTTLFLFFSVLFFYYTNCLNYSFLYSNALKRRAAVRILGRRYPLTATAFKFLEIGIRVDPPSYVEIAIGDHRGRELILSLETWKGLYEQRHTIQNYLNNDSSNDVHTFIGVGPLTVRFHKINDTRVISLESADACMMMVEATLHRLFDLDPCIDIMFDRLVRLIATVDIRFTQFSNIASTVPNHNELATAIRASDVFNKQQLLDCELIALAFSP